MINFANLGQALAHFLGERTHYGVKVDSPTRQQQQEYLQTFGLESLLPYRSYDPPSQLFYNENSVGFVLETAPMVGCTEEMQRELSGLFQHTLTEGACLQFLLYADPRLDPLLATWQEPRRHKTRIFADMAQRRADYLRGLVSSETSEVTPRHFRCLVSYSEQGHGEGPVETLRLKQVREQIKGALKTLGVPVHVCDAQALIQFVDGLLNFSLSTTASPLKWRPLDGLAGQMTQIGEQLQVEANGLLFQEGTSMMRAYSVLREPDYWSLHAMGELIGDGNRAQLQLRVPFVLHYGLTVCDQQGVEARLERPQAWVETQARSKVGKNIPSIREQARELDFVRQQRAQGERYVQSSLTVLLFAPTPRFLEEEHILKSLFRSKRWELKEDRYLHLPQLLGCLPMMWGEGMVKDLQFGRRLKTTLSSEAANLLPLQGEWQGNKTDGMLLVGRRGQVFGWDPFQTASGNFNVSVVGRPGSGKSVFMQELVMNALSTGGQVFIIDVGRSFEKTVKLLGGTYLEFTPETLICLNPFSAIPGDDARETDDALAMLRSVVSLMAAPKEGTTDLEDAYLERAIKEAWQHQGPHASISDVARALKAWGDPLAVKLASMLFPYTEDGSYGRYFQGSANVDLSAPMVVVELEELKERKDLQSVILQLIILQITNRLYCGDRKTRTYLVLDEAWDLLRARQAGVFIETAARRFRKYRGSLVVGTQSVHDFYVSPGAQAAFDNSDWLCMLSQKQESIDQLKKMERISLDPYQEEILKSLKTKAGAYSEVMIRGAHGYAVGRLVLDPFSNLLYSTKAEEFAAVNDYLQQGMPLAQALDTLIAQQRGGTCV